MKKSIFIILLVCFCFIFSGCNGYPEVGLVNNSDGTIMEYYYIPFPEVEMREIILPTDVNKIIYAKNKIKEECDKIFQNYINVYQSQIELSTELSLSEKTELVEGVTFTSNLNESNEILNYQIEYIRYVLNFNNSKCYNIFKKINNEIQEEKQVIVEKTLFTTTTKVVKDPIFDKIVKESITLGQNCLSTANSLMEECLGSDNWNKIKENLTGYSNGIKHFNYVYIVPTSRLHSNATEIARDGNYYYHIWTIDANNLNKNSDSIIQIEYWTTTANRVIWYVIALGISLGVIGSIYIVGKIKEKSN